MTLRRFLSLTRNGPKGLLVAVALLAGLAACAEDDAAPAEPPARPAKLFEVEETLNARTTNFPAVITEKKLSFVWTTE